MSLPRLSLANSKLNRAVVSTMLLAGLTAAGGCESLDFLNPNKSLLDPTEMGRYDKEPLLVPILDNLDTGIEEPEDQFLNASDPKPEDLVASDQDYSVGKNDLLSVTINDLVAPGVETTKTTRVSESGNISLPLIGQIKATGLTEAELEQAIADAYNKAKLIQNAQVSVTVNEARGRAFSILGAVGSPGQYAIVNSDFRVLDALVLAHDTQAAGADYLYIIRKTTNSQTKSAAKPAAMPTTNPGSDVFEPRMPATDSGNGGVPQNPGGEKVTTIAGQPPSPADSSSKSFPGFDSSGATSDKRVIKISLVPLRNGDLKYNVVIRPEDMLIVPQPVVGEYYMGGHVARVGVYSLTGRTISLRQAIVSAGMLDQVAIPERTDIIRRIGPDKEVFARVNLNKIFSGEQADLFVKPDDVIQVGTNAVAPFLAALRGAFRFTYGFGFVYDRNLYTGNNNNGG